MVFLPHWWGARVVEWAGLENRKGCKSLVSSNLTPTAYANFGMAGAGI